MHITENKWRAARYGIDGNMIDFGRQKSMPFAVLMDELLHILEDVTTELDTQDEVEFVRTILARGTSADRQIAVYERHGGDDNNEEALTAVVDHLVKETKLGL